MKINIEKYSIYGWRVIDGLKSTIENIFSTSIFSLFRTRIYTFYLKIQSIISNPTDVGYWKIRKMNPHIVKQMAFESGEFGSIYSSLGGHSRFLGLLILDPIRNLSEDAKIH